jgi:hypothetical protein
MITHSIPPGRLKKSNEFIVSIIKDVKDTGFQVVSPILLLRTSEWEEGLKRDEKAE